MQTVTTIPELRTAIREARAAGKSIGLVPTMGALHAGHLSLVQASVAECGYTVATIFVNPTQFGPTEDFSKYPRTFEDDQRLLTDAGCDLLFAPVKDALYPTGFGTWVDGDTDATDILCGAYRPGHFRGVLTVVAKLFNLVQPDVAYFGQKDFQQAWLIQRMARDLDFPLEVKVHPAVRESDGLAMSSRNRYLSASERQAAAVIPRTLAKVQMLVEAGETDLTTLEAGARTVLDTEPGFRLQYLEFRDAETLSPFDGSSCGPLLLVAIAGYAGATRLIDNDVITIPVSQKSVAVAAEEVAHVS